MLGLEHSVCRCWNN